MTPPALRLSDDDRRRGEADRMAAPPRIVSRLPVPISKSTFPRVDSKMREMFKTSMTTPSTTTNGNTNGAR